MSGRGTKFALCMTCSHDTLMSSNGQGSPILKASSPRSCCEVVCAEDEVFEVVFVLFDQVVGVGECLCEAGALVPV